MNSRDAQIDVEQQYATTVYARIDELTRQVSDQLARVILEQDAATHQNRSERDSFAAYYEDRRAMLESVAHSALFGRLDMADGQRHYIGRIGLFTEDRTQLLVDWRAPAAAAFYQATPRHRMNVKVRRHILTRGRRVTGIEDDVLDASILHDEEHDTSALQGEGALLTAVSASRTGRMGDIVATIQAEQDRIIRHPSRGVLVVQGGPGTGKTAVALHRAAYQLYTYRQRLEASGVLIIAPTRGFMRYIERVLPSLGETGLVMLTPGELIPGLHAQEHDDSDVALIKGSLAMAKVLKRAVRQRQMIPSAPIPLSIDGIQIALTPEHVTAARAEARATHRPHNQARTTFVRAALDALVVDYKAELARQGRRFTDEDHADLLADLRHNHGVKVALNRCWLPYSPRTFLRSFFADPTRIAKAARHDLSADDVRALHRSKDSAWTVEDVPLLDEVAELLGDDDAAQQRSLERESHLAQESIEYASKVLDMFGESSIVSAGDLAAHINTRRDPRSLAEKASQERTWTYGHIVVDEAQELSAMMWRALMRRNPSKSFTIVGDVAQTSAPAGATAWSQALAPFVEDRATIEELSVNYRTPQRIMERALAVARAYDLHVSEVRSVREGDYDVRFERSRSAEVMDLAEATSRAVTRALDDVGGRAAIVCPPQLVQELRSLIEARVGEERIGVGAEGIDREISIMGPAEVKGLEFDSTVVVEPLDLVRAHDRGIGDLYVAMTRPTQILAVVHSSALPRGLEPPAEQ